MSRAIADVVRNVADERVLTELCRCGGFLSEADAVRYAIERAATFLDIVVPPEAYAIGWRPEMAGLLEAERRLRAVEPPRPVSPLFDEPASGRSPRRTGGPS